MERETLDWVGDGVGIRELAAWVTRSGYHPDPILAISRQGLFVADDVADTGPTLRAVHEFSSGIVAQSPTAVQYEKPTSVVAGDYVWRRTDRWIDFPWSTDPPPMGGTADA